MHAHVMPPLSVMARRSAVAVTNAGFRPAKTKPAQNEVLDGFCLLAFFQYHLKRMPAVKLRPLALMPDPNGLYKALVMFSHPAFKTNFGLRK